MQTQEYVEPAKKLTNRDLPAAVGAAPRLSETTHSSKVPLSPSACVIDFFQATDRILPGSQDGSDEIEIDLQTNSVIGHRLPAVHRVDQSITSRIRFIGSFQEQPWSISFSQS
jgi:hypothetical protein